MYRSFDPRLLPAYSKPDDASRSPAAALSILDFDFSEKSSGVPPTQATPINISDMFTFDVREWYDSKVQQQNHHEEGYAIQPSQMMGGLNANSDTLG